MNNIIELCPHDIFPDWCAYCKHEDDPDIHKKEDTWKTESYIEIVENLVRQMK